MKDGLAKKLHCKVCIIFLIKNQLSKIKRAALVNWFCWRSIHIYLPWGIDIPGENRRYIAGRLFDSLIHKIQTKVTSWKGKLLSQDGWLVLIWHVLTSMVTHTRGVLPLPTGVLQRINSILSTFFSRESNGREKRKWGAWANLCKPVEEGGIRVIFGCPYTWSFPEICSQMTYGFGSFKLSM